MIERAALALMDYIEEETDGFRILVRDSPPGQSTGSFASLMGDVASQVEHLMVAQFKGRGLDTKAAPMYAQMLVGLGLSTSKAGVLAPGPDNPRSHWPLSAALGVR